MVIGWRKLYSGLESRYVWRFHAGSIGNLLLLVTFRKTLTCFGQWGIPKATPISILQFLSVCLICLGSSVLSWCSLLKVSIGTRNTCPCLFSHLTPLTSFFVCFLRVLCLYFAFYFSHFNTSASWVAEKMAPPAPAPSFAWAKFEEAGKWALSELPGSTDQFSI